MKPSCQCGVTPVIRGALHCWNVSCSRRVGRYGVEEGQLIWTCTLDPRETATLAFAVLLGDQQEQAYVEDVKLAEPRAELQLRLRGHPEASARVRVRDLVRAANREEQEEQVVAHVGEEG